MKNRYEIVSVAQGNFKFHIDAIFVREDVSQTGSKIESVLVKINRCIC